MPSEIQKLNEGPVEATPAIVPAFDPLARQAVDVVVTPTQVRRPWRSTIRTVFQALVGLAALAPLIAAAVEEATGYDLDGVPFVVVALAGAAAVTRVMAIPAVEAFLRRFLPFLAAAPSPADERPGQA